MSLISIPNTFSAGAVIVASQHNANFSTIYSDYNGNIDNTNIAPAAGIAYSKLSLTGSILNADLAGSIADSKLSQITTASKVSGTAITGLASLPSGAGVIPTANLGSGTANSGTILYGDQTYKTAPSSVSNCLFQYSAITSNSVTLGTGTGEITGSSNTPTTGGTWRFLEARAAQNTYVSVWSTQWKKIAGVSTITIYAEIWGNTGSDSCTLKVDVGSASGNVTGTTSQVTPEWKNFTIDVSGLSTGTVYTVTASIEHTLLAGTTSIYLGNLIAFGS